MDEVLAVHGAVGLLENVDVVVGAQQQQRIEQVLVRAEPVACAVQEPHVAADGAKGLEPQRVLEVARRLEQGVRLYARCLRLD